MFYGSAILSERIIANARFQAGVIWKRDLPCYHQLKWKSMKRRREQSLYFGSVMVDSNHFTNARALALVSLPEG
jgi:hypothetical protein